MKYFKPKKLLPKLSDYCGSYASDHVMTFGIQWNCHFRDYFSTKIHWVRWALKTDSQHSSGLQWLSTRRQFYRFHWTYEIFQKLSYYNIPFITEVIFISVGTFWLLYKWSYCFYIIKFGGENQNIQRKPPAFHNWLQTLSNKVISSTRNEQEYNSQALVVTESPIYITALMV